MSKAQTAQLTWTSEPLMKVEVRWRIYTHVQRHSLSQLRELLYRASLVGKLTMLCGHGLLHLHRCLQGLSSNTDKARHLIRRWYAADRRCIARHAAALQEPSDFQSTSINGTLLDHVILK